MPYQLEFSEERALHELWAGDHSRHKGPGAELRRAYDALLDISICPDSEAAVLELRRLYLQSFHAYGRGDLQGAELLAASVTHLCRATWLDAKVDYLLEHFEDLPHVPGLNTPNVTRVIEAGLSEIESRLARLKLTGLADRFGTKARQHLDTILSMNERNNLMADTHLKAAFEYCLATEALHSLEFRSVA
ncbi:MAG: hypothetical protein HY074_02730 [Deltaproteobacteria bacterium]|nr:hypothetical protein [Deltaproteobacteria bacterium]